MLGCFNWPDEAYNWRSFTDRINTVYCGHEMYPSKTEWAMLCSHCRERYYPQIAPCIIVAIRRDDSILPRPAYPPS